MIRNFTATPLIIFASILPQFACAAPVSSAEIKFREQMGLVDYQSVEYRDSKGAAISFSGEQATAVLKLESAKSSAPIPKSKLAKGVLFPAFKLAATDGSMVDNEALRGRYTLVSFYFADCAPCIKEVPMLNAFVQRTGFGWRTLANAKELIDQAGVKSYPTFALLDQGARWWRLPAAWMSQPRVTRSTNGLRRQLQGGCSN